MGICCPCNRTLPSTAQQRALPATLLSLSSVSSPGGDPTTIDPRGRWQSGLLCAPTMMTTALSLSREKAPSKFRSAPNRMSLNTGFQTRFTRERAFLYFWRAGTFVTSACKSLLNHTLHLSGRTAPSFASNGSQRHLLLHKQGSFSRLLTRTHKMRRLV